MERRVSTGDLKLGMFVCRLDRPWDGTPFPLQGFHVRHKREIEQLQSRCRFVYIDVLRGVAADRYLDADPAPQPDVELKRLIERGPGRYDETRSLADELPTAKEIQQQMSEVVHHLMDEIHSGGGIDPKQVQKTVTPIVESILRNPDAFLWLTKMKRRDSYTYSHALDACALAVALGRQLGFGKDDLDRLATGALLFDVGKMKLPVEILNKPGRLTEAEYETVRKHVQYGMEIVREVAGIHKRSLDMIAHHHERHNGSGYPNGLQGAQIPVFARIAGIVDTYDAITSDRAYAKALSPHEAIRSLYEMGGVDFQPELVEQFIQCLGVYPTGTLVELSTGEVGVVIAQNRVRRLRPNVMLILGPDKVAYGTYPVVDLMAQVEDKDGNRLDILRALEPGSYGIDPTEFYL